MTVLFCFHAHELKWLNISVSNLIKTQPNFFCVNFLFKKKKKRKRLCNVKYTDILSRCHVQISYITAGEWKLNLYLYVSQSWLWVKIRWHIPAKTCDLFKQLQERFCRLAHITISHKWAYLRKDKARSNVYGPWKSFHTTEALPYLIIISILF